MNIKSWDDFNKKNREKTSAFENMCRVLFLRKFQKTNDFQYDYNHPGLEFSPVFCKNIKDCEYTEGYIGIQCKYTITYNNEAVYKEIKKSLEAVVKYYLNGVKEIDLKQIFIYTNANLQTDEIINLINNKSKKTKSSSNKTPREYILSFEDDYGVKIVWQKEQNILDELLSPENIDLYKLYFDDSRELDFINDALSGDEKTFILSDSFININLNDNITIDDLPSKMNDKVNLILGQAGTGKTMLIKKLHFVFGKEFQKNYFTKKPLPENTIIPVLVKLRECINGNLESLINEKQSLYNLNITNSDFKYIYLLDGLDEVSYKDLGNVLFSIANLENMNSTDKIIISSRIGSNNLLLFREHIKSAEYLIQNLIQDDIKRYFEVKNNKFKIDCLNLYKEKNTSIISEIDDVFTLNLFWNSIEEIDINTTKISLIEMAFKDNVNQYSKLNNIPLPHPIYKNIFEICKELALFMQEHFKLIVEINVLQNIISKKFNNISCTEINTIINALTDICLESSQKNTDKIIIAFKHRRLQEYFLYKKIEEIFFKKPSILRKLKLLPNRDFIINIFLTQTLCNAKKEKNLINYLSLKLFEFYLSSDYWYEYRNSLVGNSEVVQ